MSEDYKKNLAEVVNTLRGKGWTEQAIAGAVANALGEGGFKTSWQKAGGTEQSFGHWQYNFGGGEGNIYAAWLRRNPGKNPKASSTQAEFLDYRMEQIHPGFSKMTDAQRATLIQETQFERHRGGPKYGGNVSRALQMVASVPRGEVQPQTTVAAAAAGVKDGAQIMVGDSIADGIAGALGIPKDAVGGTTPEQIYGRIRGHIKDFAGKRVGVAMGSNSVFGGGGAYSAKQMGFVRATLKELNDAGAKMTLAGVGQGVQDYKRINAELAQMAKDFGIPFTGELPGTGPGGRLNKPAVHPRGVKGHEYDPAAKPFGEPVAPVVNQVNNTTFHGVTDPHGVARAQEDLKDRHGMMTGLGLRARVA
jgi:hypothetical protein